MSDTEEPTENPELPPKDQNAEVDDIPFSKPGRDRTQQAIQDLLDGKRAYGSEVPPWRRRSQKRPDELKDDDPITLSFRMTGKDLKRINLITKTLAISKSDFFREAINKLLEQEESFVAKELLHKSREDPDVPF